MNVLHERAAIATNTLLVHGISLLGESNIVPFIELRHDIAVSALRRIQRKSDLHVQERLASRRPTRLGRAAFLYTSYNPWSNVTNLASNALQRLGEQ